MHQAIRPLAIVNVPSGELHHASPVVSACIWCELPQVDPICTFDFTMDKLTFEEAACIVLPQLGLENTVSVHLPFVEIAAVNIPTLRILVETVPIV